MAEDRSKISTGPNDRPLNETIAGTGPGVPDEALAPGQELPTPPSDAEVKKAARKLGVPRGRLLEGDNRKLAAGVAMGIGSAAIVAALLYGTRPKRKDR